METIIRNAIAQTDRYVAFWRDLHGVNPDAPQAFADCCDRRERLVRWAYRREEKTGRVYLGTGKDRIR